jgi:signal transduction histidine kinase
LAIGLQREVVHGLAATLTRLDGLLAVEVIDDGTGFTPDTGYQAPGDGHLGLRTMSEWVQLAGGSLQVRSAPAAGTAVSINLPIRPRP